MPTHSATRTRRPVMHALRSTALAVVRRTFRALGSFHLSVAIFGALTLITWAGTMSQETIGLFQSQRLYFESWLVVRQFGDVPVPVLPGGLLLMTALLVNLVIGGLIRFVPRARARARGRARVLRALSGAGIVTTHLGICALLVASFAKYSLAEEGDVQLFEGDSAREAVSYHDWEVAVSELIDGGLTRDHVIPYAAFADRSGDLTSTAHAAGLPFRLVLADFAPNAEIRRAPLPPAVSARLVDGYYLLGIAPHREWERNVAGCRVRAETATGDVLGEGLLWGLALHPWSVSTDGRKFAVTLRKRRAPMPFRLQLDRFTHEYHPNTEIPRVFMSDVTVIGDEDVETRRIRMNEPLRRDGTIVFQSSWGPPGAAPGTPLWSGFTVVRNPADAWPWYALYVIAAGMTLHFVARAIRFLRDQAAELRRRGA